MIRASRRIGAVLVLAGTLTTLPALARQNPPAGERSDRPGVAQAIRETVSSAWRQLTNLWAANGSRLDPFGNPLSANPPSGTPPQVAPTQDTGSGFDPFG